MKNIRLQFVGLLILAALLLGLVLRDVVELVIIRPSAYFFWMLGVFYRFIPQPVIWLLLILFLLYLTLGNFVGNMRWPRLRNTSHRQLRGPLDDLAAQIERKNTGVYFKCKQFGQFFLLTKKTGVWRNQILYCIFFKKLTA